MADKESGVELIDPTSILLARMLRDGTEAKAITEAIEARELFTLDRRLFLFVSQMLANGQTVTPKGVYRAAQSKDPELLPHIESIGKLAVSRTVENDTKAIPLTDAIELFKRWKQARAVATILDEAIETLDFMEPRHVIERVQSQLESVSRRDTSATVHDDIDAQSKDLLSHLNDEAVTGIPFGFRALDQAVVPMLFGNLILVGGATGSGKSAFVRNIARAIIRNVPEMKVAMHSMEMTALEQWLNLCAMDAGIDIEKAAQPRLMQEHEKEALARVKIEYKEHRRLRINDRSGVTPHQLLQTMKRYEAEGYRIQIIDHFHEIDYDTEGNEQKMRVLIGETAGMLKTFAKQTRSIIIALVQLVKMDKTVEPNDANIREAAKIGEEADKILFTYRPLIACVRGEGGALVPAQRTPMSEARIFASEVTKKMLQSGTVLSLDDQRVYVKLGKQRIRPRQGIVSIRFNSATGLMFDRNREGE